jgi:hypothetical protein
METSSISMVEDLILAERTKNCKPQRLGATAKTTLFHPRGHDDDRSSGEPWTILDRERRFVVEPTVVPRLRA